MPKREGGNLHSEVLESLLELEYQECRAVDLMESERFEEKKISKDKRNEEPQLFYSVVPLNSCYKQTDW